MNEEATIGIYSYPKSGNTWVRQILASILDVGKDDLSKFIPDIHQQKVAENAINFNGKNIYIYKSHNDVEVRNNAGRPLNNSHIVHIRRHPLDVFLSYMNFVSNNVTGSAPVKFSSVEEIIGTDLFEAYFDAFMITGILQPDFKAAGSWFTSNKRWLQFDSGERNIAFRSVRYEDMFDDPIGTLSFLTDWLGVSEDHIKTALQEADARTSQDGKFFWKRKARTYEDMLPEELIRRFYAIRGEDSAALGYPASEAGL